MSQQIEQILNVECPSKMHHQDLNDQKVQRQEANIKKLKEVLSKNNMFNTVENEDGTKEKLAHSTSNIIMPQAVTENILDTENRGRIAYEKFVKERISGPSNLWDKMSKLKVIGWTDGAKPIKAKVGAEEIVLKQSSSLLARLLIIARSSRDVDLKDVISMYELSAINHTLQEMDLLQSTEDD